MKEWLEQKIISVLFVLFGLLITQAGILWLDVHNLKTYHADTAPLEKQLMMFEVSKVGDRVTINAANIEKLEDQVRALQ